MPTPAGFADKVDLFFDNPDFRTMILGYLAGTYEEFRAEMSAERGAEPA